MRLGVHLIWEGVLALCAVALAVAVVATGAGFSVVLAQAAPAGLIATGLALSLRTATPNLAVGPLAALTGAVAAYLGGGYGWPQPVALTIAILVALVLGIVLALFVAVVSVPAWAASIVTAVMCQGLLLGLTQEGPRTWTFPPSVPSYTWFALFAVVSVGGGLLWLVQPVRDTLSASRREGDQGRWAGLRPGIGALIGLTGSSLLAGLGGLAQLMRLQISVPTADWATTAAALAAVLLGGVSLYGRRGGIAGTLLGVLILAMAGTLLAYHAVPTWITLLVTGLAAALGLVVNRGVESLRPGDGP
ncbi:ABC transporter permease subunit [Nonomuraea sediminis]|uniref:ABC transporter permease subunit n=1 Tax=Nonomuraea sediminis TaxID=2835864 RepID=UPI001BDBC152|nr:hypothetical protein [Nonomuraea sediminis]